MWLLRVHFTQVHILGIGRLLLLLLLRHEIRDGEGVVEVGVGHVTGVPAHHGGHGVSVVHALHVGV